MGREYKERKRETMINKETMTKKQCEIYDSLSTNEVKTDIQDTQDEIDDFHEEQKILRKNPVKNKLRLYMISGNISSRKEFIDKLKNILKWRDYYKEKP